MSLVDRDAVSADALLTDLYLDALLAGTVLGGDDDPAAAIGSGLDPAARSAGDRLRRDLVRVHPSFRFEERLATRLAEAAISMRLPAVVGGEGRVVPFRPGLGPTAPLPPDDDDAAGRDRARPLLIGGALTSAALSLAGAAFVAWRRGRPGPGQTAMSRAVREARRTGRRTAAIGRANRRAARPSTRGLD